MCTGRFYDDLLTEPALQGIRFVVTTLPGFGGTAPLADPTLENFAHGAGALAAEHGCDAIVGHSFGGNVALELVAAGGFAGPVMLIEPAFSRADEYAEIALLDRIARVPAVGHAAWWVTVKTFGVSARSEFPKHRRRALIAEMKRNDPRDCRAIIRHYFAYLDRHGALVPRLTAAEPAAIVVFADESRVGLTDAERQGLGDCPTVELVDVTESGHCVMIDQPARTAELVLDLLSRARPGSPATR
jgi:pimeloyl-ACP methyl ester carboxylesterase